MDLLEPDDTPLTVHEDILKYLKDQDLLRSEDEQTLTNFTEENVRQILEQLLQKFERNQKLKEDYEDRVKAHNQFPLFNLQDVLPDFLIDDEMYDALTFRENLIIQHLVGDNELVPESVGGLCLDIQKATGKPPPERKCIDIDTRLARIMKVKGDKDVVQADDIKTDNKAMTVGDAADHAGLEDSIEIQDARSVGKFLIYLSSQFDFDGENAGSTITTWVDRNLHTLEEARKEFYTRIVRKRVENVEKVIRQTCYDIDGKTSRQSSDIYKRVSEPSGQKFSKDDSQNVNVENKAAGEYSKTDARVSLKIVQSARKSNIKSRDRMSQVGQIKSAITKSEQNTGTHRKSATIDSPQQQNASEKSQGRVSTPRSSKTISKPSSRKSCSKDQSKVSQKSRNEEDKNQDVKEEDIKEDIIEETQFIQKSLYVGLLKGFYYIKHRSDDNVNIDDRKFYSLLKAKDYISEGANFLLHRYLAKTIYIGTFELSTMYINGDMCRNIYSCTGPESRLINDQKIDVCVIYRTIIEECGIEHRCITVLTLQGQIVNQSWEGLDYTLQINPLLNVSNYEPICNEQILLKHAWESDMQLMSRYLDEKVSNEIKIKSYMIDHPEFRNMITDYIHTILLLKPEDIIDFTISHFLSFAPQYLPQNDYFIN